MDIEHLCGHIHVKVRILNVHRLFNAFHGQIVIESHWIENDKEDKGAKV